MKRPYIKPDMEIECYALDANIASNCAIVVNSGPQIGGHTGCQEYYDYIGIPMPSTLKMQHNINFYEDTNCDCYTTAGNGFFTS